MKKSVLIITSLFALSNSQERSDSSINNIIPQVKEISESSTEEKETAPDSSEYIYWGTTVDEDIAEPEEKDSIATPDENGITPVLSEDEDSEKDTTLNDRISEPEKKDTAVYPAEERSDVFVESTHDKETIAVLDFGGQNVDKSVVIPLTNRFRVELMNTGKYDVIEREEMYKILEEQDFQRSDCVDQTCAVEAGQLIAVKRIVTGTVAKIGGIYNISVKMLNVETGRIEQNINEDCDCPIEKVLTETMKRIALKMAGVKVEEKKIEIDVRRGDASLFLKTDPKDASVYIDGKLMDGRTPKMFENLTPGNHTVQVKKADFQASKDVELIANEIVRISLKLEKRKTVLKITSDPSEAEVFLNKNRTLKIKPDQLTPAIFYDITPGKHWISLFKIGFIDTTLSIDVKKFEQNNIKIDLKELKDNERILDQKEFVKLRTQRRPGRVMIFSSVGFAAAGGALLYLAIEDYDDAKAAKKTLDKSSINTLKYDSLVKENREKSDDGDFKAGLSAGLLGAAGLFGGLGIVLYF